MAVGPAEGRPCDVLREHLQYNSGSYSGTDTDDFRWTATIATTPTRPAVPSEFHDATAYGTTLEDADSWIIWLRERQQQV